MKKHDDDDDDEIDRRHMKSINLFSQTPFTKAEIKLLNKRFRNETPKIDDEDDDKNRFRNETSKKDDLDDDNQRFRKDTTTDKLDSENIDHEDK